MRRSIFISFMIAGIVVLLSSCSLDLPMVSQIEDTRVIGARVNVPDDSTLAWPNPGETAQVSWVVVHPKLEEDNESLQSMFITCTPAPISIGIPFCIEFFSLGEGIENWRRDLTGILGSRRITCDDLSQISNFSDELPEDFPFNLFCVDGEPSFELSIPENSSSKSRLVLGVICDHGIPVINTDEDLYKSIPFGCELKKGGEEILVTLKVPIQKEDIDPNHHPSLDDARFEIDGRNWPEVQREELLEYLLPSDADKERFDCEQAVQDDVLIELGSEGHLLSVEFDSDDIDTFTDDGEKESEDLIIAHYSTAGKIMRDISIVRSDFKTTGFDVEWTPPEEIPEEGRLVRFFFTVRDGRGGFDSIMRALCLREK